MLKPFLFIYCVLIIFQITYTTDYCKMCKNKTHTMCKYKKGPAKSCVHYNSVAMKPAIRTKIENLHNELRNKVASGGETRGSPGPQPSATNMFIMSWDDELSEIAQRWADQCRSVTEVNQHDDCKDTQRFRVGQNVMRVIRGTKPIAFDKIVTQIIQNWYNETDRLEPEQVSTFKGADDPMNEVGHYAQLIWATSKYIGCAHASFAENITQEGTTTESTVDTFVCNYGPTGNIVDASIYKVGKPCSACKCTEKFPALCEDMDKRTQALEKTETKTEAKKEVKTETKREAKLETNTEANCETTQLQSSATELTHTSETKFEAYVPFSRNPHHNHHHRIGERCPFESSRTRLRLLHQEGDECFCLFRIKDSAKNLLPDTYLLHLFCLIVYYF